MKKSGYIRHRSVRPRPSRSHRGFSPVSSRLLIGGHILLLAALCDFAARLFTYEMAGAVGSIHLMDTLGGSVSASLAILWGVALGLDYLERTCPPRK